MVVLDNKLINNKLINNKTSKINSGKNLGITISSELSEDVNLNGDNITDIYIKCHNNFVKKYGKKTFVFMQVGSFFEAYATEKEGPKLHEIADLLDIRCTRKSNKKNTEKIDKKNPFMCGFPTPSLDSFMKTLIDHDYTVIIIEQTTPPPNPKREITGIYSKGTYMNNIKQQSNFLVSLYIKDELQRTGKYLMCIGMGGIDISTGVTYHYEAFSQQTDDKFALDEASRFIYTLNPSEIIINYEKEENSKLSIEEIITYLELENKMVHKVMNINKKYQKKNIQDEIMKKIYPECHICPAEYLDIERNIYTIINLCMLFDFVYDHTPKVLNNIKKPELFFENKHLILGNNAINQLNIVETENSEYNKKYGSLINICNKATTHMGKRYIKDRLTRPIISINKLNKIYDCNDILLDNELREKITQHLENINDIERLYRKINISTIHPNEFYNLYLSYVECSKIQEIIKKYKEFDKYFLTEKEEKKFNALLNEIRQIYNLEELKKYNLQNIETNIFNKNIYHDLDEIQNEINDGGDFMNKLCFALSNLADDNKTKNKDNYITIKENDRDGHYLYITNIRAKLLQEKISKLDKIKVGALEIDPKKLEFKSQQKNYTKIVFTELEAKSDRINKLKEDLQRLNYNYFIEKNKILLNKYGDILNKINIMITYIDYIKSNAEVAKLFNYTRPKLINSDESYVSCEKLRHPIVERIIDCEYIPNNINLGKDLKGMLLYGLNSSGKSICMKSVGIAVIMAQAGLYVACDNMELSPYHSLYTRITGTDNIFKGLSSFALEMLELKAILKRASKNTLVIGDEICRGTEYISGNALVASAIITLSKKEASFIFATHLHDIANMNIIKELDNIKPYHLTVSYDQENDCLIYDRKLKEGSGDPIYGITVARYIINDVEFIETANNIKNDILKSNGSLISDKINRYNSQVLINECQLCQEKNILGYNNLETHHINFQKDYDEDNNNKNKKHLKKNDKANLVVLCSKCHDKLHNNEINLEGYKQTSKGRKIIVKTK
jgi:DNA mismatch repair protein MutS